jgi:hypothetical protein
LLRYSRLILVAEFLLLLKSLAVGFPGYQERRVSHDGAVSGNIEGEAVMIITAF